MIDHSKIPKYQKGLALLNIPIVYEQFPTNFTMDINGWSFPGDDEQVFLDIEFTQDELNVLNENNLLESLKKGDGGKYQLKRLKTMDIEIAPDQYVDKMNGLKDRVENEEFSRNGKINKDLIRQEFSNLYQKTCTQRCPHCFNQEDDFYTTKILQGQRLLKWKEIFEYLKKAKRYGLQSVKFLGIGEIFKNPDLFNILDDLRREKILFCIFTKGSVFGDDPLAKSCGYKNIDNSEDLVKKLSTYPNLSILLGANSFIPEIQDQMVGCSMSGSVNDYTKKRNNGLKLLIKHGFNDPQFGKRLALMATPVTPLVSDETIEMYKWAAKRNITVVTTPTMVSGKGGGELEWLFNEFEQNSILINRFDPQKKMSAEQRYTEWIVDFYTDIYCAAIKNNILSKDAILSKRGISAYAGAAYCQQKHNGLYLRLPGTIQECPGRSIGAIVEENIRDKGLLCSWIGSINYKRNDNCKSLCSVKMKNLTNSEIEMCNCCEVYNNVGSMPIELESRVFNNIKNYHTNQYRWS